MMLTLGLLILGAAGGAGEAKAPSPILRVTLPEASLVKGIRFSLGEAVQIEGEDLERVARAQEILVGYTPNPGFERKLRREAIVDLLAGAGFARSEIRVSGEPLVAVTTQAKTILPAAIVKAGEQFLYDHLTDLGLRDFQVAVKGAPVSMTVPVGNQGVRLEAIWRGEKRTSGQASLDLRILVDEEPYSVVPMSYSIKHFGIAAAAGRYIAIGEKFSPENVEFRRVELPAAPVEAVASLDQLAGRECVRPIKPGDVISTADLRAVPVVLKDQPVGIVLRTGNLRIQMRGIAKADGFLGAMVAAENPETGKIVYGKVVAPGQLEIPMPGAR